MEPPLEAHETVGASMGATPHAHQLSMDKRLATLSTAAAQELATILRRHTSTETDLADALNLRRLPSHLHNIILSS